MLMPNEELDLPEGLYWLDHSHYPGTIRINRGHVVDGCPVFRMGANIARHQMHGIRSSRSRAKAKIRP